MDDSGFSLRMERLGPFERNPVIAAAVSGGADSMALALLAKRWAEDREGKLIALTVDHGLRPDSAREAENTGRALRRLGIAQKILTHSGEKPSANIQEEARNIRYGLLTGWCRENHVLHLLTAHHRDDQAETFLMRLERGSGVRGLACMAPVSCRNGVRILRPLLDVPRAALRRFLEEREQGWIEDPSNSHPRFTRTRIRLSLVSAPASDMDALSRRIASTAASLGGAWSLLQGQIAEAAVKTVIIRPEGYGRINLPAFLDLPRDIAAHVLSGALQCVNGKEIDPPRFKKLERLLDNILASGDDFTATFHGCQLAQEKNKNSIVIYREYSKIEEDIKVTNDLPVTWDGRFLAAVSGQKSNITIGKLGHDGWRLLKTVVNPPLVSRPRDSLHESRGRKDTSHINSCHVYPGNNGGYFQDMILALPKRVIPTLPAFRRDPAQITGEALENIICVPHLGYYGAGSSGTSFQCGFAPAKPLAGYPFG